MAYLNDRVLDRGLNALLDASTLHFCTEQPPDFASLSSYSLASYSALSLTGPADASPNGRKITVGAILDAVGSFTGDAGYWVLVDTANSRILAGDEIDPPQPIGVGDPVTLPEITIRFPDAL